MYANSVEVPARRYECDGGRGDERVVHLGACARPAGVRNLSRFPVIRRERRVAPGGRRALSLSPDAERPQPIVTARLRSRGADRIRCIPMLRCERRRTLSWKP